MATNKTVTFNASTPMLSRNLLLDVLCSKYATKRSIIIEGPTGTGKTQLGRDVAAKLGFPLVYFDCQVKGIEDLTCPQFTTINGVEVVRSVPHEEFGLQHGAPIVLMFDEVAKNRSLIPGITRVLLEREIGGMKLHPDSVVMGTTNLGAENFGDVVPGFVLSRVAVVRMKNATVDEMLDYGSNNGWEPSLLAAIHEMPGLIECFVDVEKPEDNPYIYDPRDPSRRSFSCPRSLHNLSDLLHERHIFGEEATMNMAMGIVGAPAAKEIMNLVTLGDTLPKYLEIVADPSKVRLPDSAGGRIISALRCLQRVDAENFSKVFTYIKRLPMEVQALFANQLMKSSTKAVWVARQADFTEFARKNYALFTQ